MVGEPRRVEVLSKSEEGTPPNLLCCGPFSGWLPRLALDLGRVELGGPCPGFSGFLLTLLSPVPPTPPCGSCPLPSLCLIFPTLPSLVPSRHFFRPPSGRRWCGWAEAWGSGSAPRTLPQPGACPWCLCHFVLLHLIHLPCAPLPAPPATAASAWEIIDTESAASSSVLLTGDFLPLRAPGWDQGPSWGLGIRDGAKEGLGRRTGGRRGRGEGQTVKEKGGRMERGRGGKETGKKKALERPRNREGSRGWGDWKEGDEGGRVWKLRRGEPVCQPASPGPSTALPSPTAHPARLLGGPSSRPPG